MATTATKPTRTELSVLFNKAKERGLKNKEFLELLTANGIGWSVSKENGDAVFDDSTFTATRFKKVEDAIAAWAPPGSDDSFIYQALIEKAAGVDLNPVWVIKRLEKEGAILKFDASGGVSSDKLVECKITEGQAANVSDQIAEIEKADKAAGGVKEKAPKPEPVEDTSAQDAEEIHEGGMTAQEELPSNSEGDETDISSLLLDEEVQKLVLDKEKGFTGAEVLQHLEFYAAFRGLDRPFIFTHHKAIANGADPNDADVIVKLMRKIFKVCDSINSGAKSAEIISKNSSSSPASADPEPTKIQASENQPPETEQKTESEVPHNSKNIRSLFAPEDLRYLGIDDLEEIVPNMVNQAIIKLAMEKADYTREGAEALRRLVAQGNDKPDMTGPVLVEFLERVKAQIAFKADMDQSQEPLKRLREQLKECQAPDCTLPPSWWIGSGVNRVSACNHHKTKRPQDWKALRKEVKITGADWESLEHDDSLGEPVENPEPEKAISTEEAKEKLLAHFDKKIKEAADEVACAEMTVRTEDFIKITEEDIAKEQATSDKIIDAALNVPTNNDPGPEGGEPEIQLSISCLGSDEPEPKQLVEGEPSVVIKEKKEYKSDFERIEDIMITRFDPNVREQDREKKRLGNILRAFHNKKREIAALEEEKKRLIAHVDREKKALESDLKGLEFCYGWEIRRVLEEELESQKKVEVNEETGEVKISFRQKFIPLSFCRLKAVKTGGIRLKPEGGKEALEKWKKTIPPSEYVFMGITPVVQEPKLEHDLKHLKDLALTNPKIGGGAFEIIESNDIGDWSIE